MDHYDILPTLYASGLVKAPQIVLLALLTLDGSGTRSSTMPRRTGLTWSHISTSITKLEHLGLAERRFPIRDGRAVTVYLTSSGKKMTKDMLRALQYAQKVASAEAVQDR